MKLNANPNNKTAKKNSANVKKQFAPISMFKKNSLRYTISREKAKKLEKEEKTEVEVPAIPNQITIDQMLEEEKPINEKEQMQNVEQAVTKQKSKKKKILSLMFMLVNIGVVIALFLTQMKTSDIMSLSEMFKLNINYGFFAVCFLAFAIMMLLHTFKIFALFKPTIKKTRFAISYKTAALGRYYDCITPLNTGGQPFQIMFMKSRGVKTSDAISVPLGKYVFYMISWSIFSTICIFYSCFSSVGNGVASSVVSAAGWIGYSINVGLMFIITFISINRKAGTKFVGGILKILHKIKLVRNYEKVLGGVMKTVDDFQGAMKHYAKNPKIFISCLLMNFSSMILNASIPFFIYCTFAGYIPGMWWDIVIKCVMIEMAASFIPLPGGTGVSELSFTALFAALFVSGQLFWAMLLWRLLTYYGYIIQGLLVMMYEYFIGEKKFNWFAKKWQLECESERFKAEKLSEFKRKKRKK